MLVFPPPFKRKCLPRCAKQILDFTFLLQIVKGGVVQGKFLGWFGDWCFGWIHAQGELEGLSTHILIFLNSIPPLLTWMSLPPSAVSRAKLASPRGPDTFQRCPHCLQTTGSFPKGGMIPHPLHINANPSPSIPEGTHLLSFLAKRGYFPISENTQQQLRKTQKNSDVSPDRWIWCVCTISGFTPHSLPAPE